MNVQVRTTARTRIGAVRLLAVSAAAFVASSVANVAVGGGVLALMSLHVIAGVITVLLLRAEGLPKAPAVP